MNPFASRAAIAVACGLATGLSAGAASADFNAVSWGGAYTASQIGAYYEPFEESRGITINSVDYNGGLAEIRAQVEAGNVTWGIVDMELSDIVRGCDEGVLQAIDPAILPPAPDGTPASEDFLPGTLHECGVSEIIWSTVIAYRSDEFGDNPPTTLADFFDVEAFPGKRSLRRSPRVNLEWALIADGVARDEVYEVLATAEGVDRAFAMLDGIKDDVVWWTAGAQPPQLLADGEVVFASAYNGRLYDAIVNEGQPIVIIWDNQIWDLDLWGIPTNAEPIDEILDFVAFSTDTQRQADQSNYISYGPARRSSMAIVPDHIKPHLPTAPENMTTALQNDFEFWADNQDTLNERFEAWLAR